jgi:hypothetical protein
MVAAAAIRGNVAEDYTPTDQRAGHSILWWDDTGQCPREGYQGRRFSNLLMVNDCLVTLAYATGAIIQGFQRTATSFIGSHLFKNESIAMVKSVSL